MPEYVSISFSVDPQADGDLVEWLAAQPARGRSAAIREAIRAAIQGQAADAVLGALAELRAEVWALEERIEALGVVGREGAAHPGAEPEDVARALDGLGL